MVVISNIKVTEFNLIKEMDNKNNKDMQKFLQFLSREEAMKLLPRKSKITVSFELSKTNTSLANGIRRCLVDEIETLSFDFDEYKDLETDDKYILCDFIKKQVELIPINQEFNYKDVEIKLVKYNNTDDIIDVMTNDFVISGAASQKNLEDIVGQNIVLCKLRPGRYIKINNIYISKGTGLQNAGKYKLLSNVTYKILDADPIVETAVSKSGVSSMITNPKKFIISYSTHRNIDHPRQVMVKCCDTLIIRLNVILENMKNISNSDKVYKSELLSLDSTDDLRKIEIKNEYWTIINMITQYCYILTNGNIKFVSPALIHPEKEVGMINIIHPDFSTLIQNAIKKIIEELNVVKMTFK